MPRLAVLGQPVIHSRSPVMQSAALAALGLHDWSYEAIEVSAEEFAERVRAMVAEGFAGVNVTLPHKVAALEVADDASPSAQAIGAANTLIFRDDQIDAENTDAIGFLDALPAPVARGTALVMGAGGSARAVVWALIEQGAEVTIWNRTPERAASLAGEFGAAAAPSGEWRAGRGDFDLVVNCTTVGMGENGADLKALPVDADAMGEPQTVVDLAYGPAETELVSAARASGANAVDGLEILVRQGAASLRLWTGLEPPIDVMRRAARQQDAPREQTAIPDPGARPRGGDGTQA